MKKQIEDENRGFFYRSGVGVSEEFPKEVTNKEDELREKENVTCKLLGCHGTNHVGKNRKHCKYHKCKDWEEVRYYMDSTLKELFVCSKIFRLARLYQ